MKEEMRPVPGSGSTVQGQSRAVRRYSLPRALAFMAGTIAFVTMLLLGIHRGSAPGGAILQACLSGAVLGGVALVIGGLGVLVLREASAFPEMEEDEDREEPAGKEEAGSGSQSTQGALDGAPRGPPGSTGPPAEEELESSRLRDRVGA